MTNKESIQAAHLGICSNLGECERSTYEFAATSCTTITAEVLKEYEEWKRDNKYYYIDGVWIEHDGSTICDNDAELIQLYLNQQSK